MPHQSRTAEEVLGGIASGTHGVVTRRQLVDAGITLDEIRHRLNSSALLREHPGVYRVGHRAPNVEARYLAAVWAGGERSLLWRAAAGHLLALLRDAPPKPEVITPTQRRIEGVITRRSRRIEGCDATVWRGIPVTTVARTLVDLAGVLTANALARACHEAGVRYGTTPHEVENVLERRPNSPGARKLRAILRGDERVTLSTLEATFLTRLRAAGLPLPETNRRARGRRVDCRWPAQRLTVELDSYRYHHTRHAWEQDRHREREAHARGDELRRYTYGDVLEHPGQMLRELRQLRPSCPG